MPMVSLKLMAGPCGVCVPAPPGVFLPVPVTFFAIFGGPGLLGGHVHVHVHVYLPFRQDANNLGV